MTHHLSFLYIIGMRFLCILHIIFLHISIDNILYTQIAIKSIVFCQFRFKNITFFEINFHSPTKEMDSAFTKSNQTVEKAALPQMTNKKHQNNENITKNSKTKTSTRQSSRMPCAYLLFPFLLFAVPLYVYDSKTEKYSYLFRSLSNQFMKS